MKSAVERRSLIGIDKQQQMKKGENHFWPYFATKRPFCSITAENSATKPA